MGTVKKVLVKAPSGYVYRLPEEESSDFGDIDDTYGVVVTAEQLEQLRGRFPDLIVEEEFDAR